MSAPVTPLTPSLSASWRSPAMLLMVMAAATQLGFASWNTAINNFAVSMAGFTGLEIGIQQSVREIPGLLAFSVVAVLLVVREQRLAYLSLVLLGVGVAVTGFFPSFAGILATTLLMSIGFHYYETVAQSLALQWLPKTEAPSILGRILAAGAVAQLVAYGLIFLCWKWLDLSFEIVFLVAGLATVAVAAFAWAAFPRFEQLVPQRKSLVLRRRYWLYYALVFMAGARRQIFVVFAGFLMVERFGFAVDEIAALFLINCVANMVLAPRIGDFIGRVGERQALTVEYVGLILVFVAYAFVSNAWVAGGLYVVDHLFFALAISYRTYLQKIADPADIAPTSGVSSTINHIAAVVIPVAFGALWLVSPKAVFLAGAGMAVVSLVLARFVPRHPGPGCETTFPGRPELAPAE